jgi:hypothetical protein
MKIQWHSSAPMFTSPPAPYPRAEGLPPPPYAPDLDLISWIEDPDHGPSRPRSWRCWFNCPHKRASSEVPT